MRSSRPHVPHQKGQKMKEVKLHRCWKCGTKHPRIEMLHAKKHDRYLCQACHKSEPAQSNSNMRTCHVCGTVTDNFCPTCLKDFETRTPADAMSLSERVAELRLLCGPLEIPIDKLHQRIEELMGRSVWTHELARFTSLIDALEASGEADHIPIEEVISPKSTAVHVVIPEKDVTTLDSKNNAGL